MSNSEGIVRYIWNEENLNEYRKELKGRDPAKAKYSWEPEVWAATHKLFFINPTGSLDQNMETISLVINYMRYIPEDTLLSRVLAYDPPIFRVQYMSETEPGSCQFQFRKVDLIEQIIKKRDIRLFRRLYQHIDLSSYLEYGHEMAVMMAEDANCNHT